MNSEVDFTIDAWVNYTGLKIREHNEQELEAFKKPFSIGWTRDLSIRAQLHSSGKRIVDVSYISPCKGVVLKSYIELGVYLRNDQTCQLEPENFTFVKQPVYKYPEEVIKQLTKQPKPAGRSANRTSKVASEQNGQMPQLTLIDESSKDLNQSQDSSFNNSIAEGRSKRRRTAPTRFDDEDYLESLNKKKILKTQTTTPSSKLNNSSNSTTTSPTANKSTTPASQPFSPKNANKKDESRQESLLNNSEDKSNSSFKSAKSSDQQTKLEIVTQLDSNSNVLINETDSTNLKENESNESNKKSDDNDNSNSLITDQKITDQANQQTAKPKTKRKYIRNKEKNQSNSLLNNNLLMGVYNHLEVSNLLQNGNFECEDNDLSDCEMPMPLVANQLLPIPPCSLTCGDSKDDIPTLLCSRCLCLFHPKCVSTGIILKDSKFVCPNCVQPDDLNNAMEDPSKILEQVNEKDLNEEAIVDLQISESSNQSTATTSQQINKQPKPIRPNVITKQNNNIRIDVQSKPSIDNLSLFAKTNGIDNNLKKLKQNLNPNLNPQIRLPPKLVRNFSNLNSNNLNINFTNNNSNNHLNNFNQSNRMKTNQQINLNQINQMINKTQMNNQLLKKMNQFNSQQQNLMNLKSSINQLANGISSNSSLATRKSHLDTMNKSLQSSQQLIESLKKATSAKAFLTSNNNPARMQTMNRNLNMRFNSRYEQLQRQRNELNRYNSEYNDPRNDPRLSKYYEYLNEKQNGFKQMIDQYQALDKIFDYLDVRDLIQCKLVNKTFNRLASDKSHWKKLNLKNLAINDWIYFSNEIVEEHRAEELCLENLRLPNRQDPSVTEDDLREQLWKDFKSNYIHLQSLNKINFGKISVQHLNYLLTNESIDNDEFVNPLYDLEELSIKNLYDKMTDSNFVSLNKLDPIRECKNLKFLRIESKQGISNDESTINFLNNLSESLPKLKQLYLPSLRGFTIENFEFLTKLNQLEVLEIGSCESWTLIESTSNDQDEEIMEVENEDNDSNQDSSEYMNQNQDSNQAKRTQSKRHKGAFQYLCQLSNLKGLYLQDVIVDEMECNQLPLCIEKITNLESLGLGLTVSPDATQTVNMLCNTLKTKLPKLRQFTVSTEDQFSNKTIFDLLLKRLDNLDELKWKVGSQVEDNGVCLVPFIKEHIESDLENEDNLDLTVENDCTEMFETCYLNDILQKHLNKTKVYLIPQ